MLILLPPSEGKAAAPRRGRGLDLGQLGHPELTASRQRVLSALTVASARDDAAELFGVSDQQLPEVRHNLQVGTVPARPASEVYTGVLYAALDWAGLSAGARRRARRSLRVQSALWGLIGPADRIPPYRLSMSVALPGLGPLAGFWRRSLAEAEAAGATLAPPGVVVDCRSSSYAAAWRLAPERAADLVAVRVLAEVNGRLQVVSHAAKYTRGLVARALLEAPRPVRTPSDVAAVVARSFRCELVDQGRGRRLDVIVGPADQLTDRAGTDVAAG